MPCSFTFDHYKEIVTLFKEKDYEFTSFSKFKQGQPKQIILRHDVDFSPVFALRLAKFEHTLDIQSNYHFLISSELYNLFSKETVLIIDEIKRLNHTLGLHLDPSAFESKIHEKDVKFSKRFLKKLFNSTEVILGKLDAFSFHRPATYGMFEEIFKTGSNQMFPVCSYDEIFTKEILYLSDSRKMWKNGCVCKHIDTLNGKSLQLLIHPIWWTEELKDRDENISDFKSQIMSEAESYLQNNLSFYKGNNSVLNEH